MKVTIETAVILEAQLKRGLLHWLTFDSPPSVELGETYRTFYPGSPYPDVGSFLALWIDGVHLLVRARDFWVPNTGHVILPG